MDDPAECEAHHEIRRNYSFDSCRFQTRRGTRVHDLEVGLWLLTHQDLRQTARVRAFLDFMGREIRNQRDFLEGRPATAREEGLFPPKAKLPD